MALKFKFKSKDEIPAEFQSLYVERDGAFVLDAEGAVEKGKLDEFRANNVALLKQLDDLKKRFEGIEPERMRKLEAEKRRLEEAQAGAQTPECARPRAQQRSKIRQFPTDLALGHVWLA